MEIWDKIANNNSHKNKVHRILAHSYILYFISFLIGICLDIVFKFKIFTSFIMAPVGLIFLILGTFLILWAQKTGHELKKVSEPKTEHFYRGPYRYTRMPTHFGLFFLMLGFGIVANAFFVVLFTLISFLISKFVFLDKEEAVLAEKYGAHYLEYKKMIKF